MEKLDFMNESIVLDGLTIRPILTKSGYSFKEDGLNPYWQIGSYKALKPYWIMYPNPRYLPDDFSLEDFYVYGDTISDVGHKWLKLIAEKGENLK